MSAHATGRFEIKSWDEKTWDGRPQNEVPGAKLTHAVITQVFHGEIEGEGTGQSLMTYREDGSASIVGLQKIVGRLGSRSGSFVLQSSGTYDSQKAIAEMSWFVVPGSGTGALSGLRGDGGYIARSDEAQPAYTLDYDFD